MKRLLLLLAALWTAGASHGQTFGPRFMWATSGYALPAGATLFPKAQQQALATSRGNVLWATLQTFKKDYAGMPCGEHRVQVFNAAGALLQQSAVLGNVSIIDAEADVVGNWYLLGAFIDSVSFPNGQLLVSPVPGDRRFIARLNAQTLACDWVVPTSFATRDAECMALADDGLYYAAYDSSYYTTINRLEYGTGTRTVVGQIRGVGGPIRSMLVDADGAIYLSGISYGNMFINGSFLPPGPACAPPAGMDHNFSFVMRMRRGGQFSWIRWMHDIFSAQVVNSYLNVFYGRRILQAGPAGSIYVTGPLTDSMTFAGYHFQKPDSFVNRDYMLARLDTSGNLIWAHQRPASAGVRGKVSVPGKHTVLVDSAFYLLSETEGPVSWGAGIATNAPDAHRATLTAYNTSSAPRWAKTTGSAYTNTQKVVADGSTVWIAGYGQDSAALRFDTVSVPVSPMVYTPYLAALTLRAPSLGTSSYALPENAGLKAWPNPTQGQLSVLLPEAGILRLLDASGAVARAATLSSGSHAVPVADLPRGIYFAELRTPGGVWVQRVVLH